LNPSPDSTESLESALRRRGIDLPPEQQALLDCYCRLLWDWNEKLNLTRHTSYEKFVDRDVVDSLQLAALIESGERVLDVGTGGGVPGIILAITRPDLEVALCESMAKKAKAVTDIVQRLGLDVAVYHARAEAVLQEEQFDTLAIRAVAPLERLMTWFKPVRGSFDQMLVTKGPAWTEERAKARERQLHKIFNLRKEAEYTIPGTDVKSVVLRIWPQDGE
jgi:16S rRNA (guanine527-N7)-methyltransferase